MKKQHTPDPQQRVAITCPVGPVLIIASAGSGKTTVIVGRVVYLLDSGVAPDRLLLLTFTNKAAREMLKRVGTATTKDTRRIWGGTYHSFAARVLRKHAHFLGYTSSFAIIDQEDARDYVSAAMDDIKLPVSTTRFPQAALIRDIISKSINTGATISDIVMRYHSEFKHHLKIICEIAEAFSTRKLKSNVMDFDDLLVNLLRLLQEHPEAGEYWKRRFEHILVDEFQDSNVLQSNIVDELASIHRSLMVVGDDAQCIYQWRGANFANMFEFPQRYPDAQTYRLETNYRSVPEIVNLGSHSINHNKNQFPKNLSAHRTSLGQSPWLVPLPDTDQQASFVARRVLELRDEGIPLSKIAVLYRAHGHALELELELMRRNIPYEVRSGIKFFEQAHIKDVLACVKVASNPRDELAFKRALSRCRGLGKTKVGLLWEQACSGGDLVDNLRIATRAPAFRKTDLKVFVDLLESLSRAATDTSSASPASQIEQILNSYYRDYAVNHFDNAEERIDDIGQLANYAATFDSVETFLTEIVLAAADRSKRKQGLNGMDVSMTDPDDEHPLVLSTIHKSKGLEWKAVFVISAAEGCFPSPRSLAEPTGEEEERRLFYVAVTRAEDQLYICYPLRSRDYSGADVLHRPSRFVHEVPQNLFEKWQMPVGPVCP